MRHLKTGRKFGRISAHRKALFRNMVTALIRRERIRTTLAKAKELRGKVEKTITLGKKGTLHARRHALQLVADKDSLEKLFGLLAERYATRPGGYTRIIKLGRRLGDDAPMAFIELVDREDAAVQKAPIKKKEKIEETAKEKKQAKAPAKKKVTQKSDDGKKKLKGTAKKQTADEKKKTPEKKKKEATAPAKKKAAQKSDNGGKNDKEKGKRK